MSRENRDAPPSTIASLLTIPDFLPPAIPEDPAEFERRRRERDESKNRVWLDRALEAAPLRAVRFMLMNPRAESLALTAVRDWFGTFDTPHLLLRGTTGTGKTVAAAWVVRAVTEPGKSKLDPRQLVTWLYPDDVCTAVLQPWAQDAARIARYVVIDELGTETRPDFPTALSRLLDRDNTHVLLTTNLSIAAFEERYAKHDRLMSRAEGLLDVVDVPGRDLRKQR